MLFNSVKIENDWLVRSSEQDVVDYVNELPVDTAAYHSALRGLLVVYILNNQAYG